MTPGNRRPHEREARDDRATSRDVDASGRDARAAARDDVAGARDASAVDRDEEFLDREHQLRRLVSAAERRHVVEDGRRESLARERAAADDLEAEQAEVDRETRRSERALDSADLAAMRSTLDWMHDTYLRDGRRDRSDAASDRTGSQADRVAAAEDRTAAEADREQSAVDDARHH